MQVVQWIQALGYAGVFLAMFIENLGIPFPVIFGLVAAAALAAGRPGGFAIAYAVLVVAQVAGATAGYLLGSTGSHWVQRRLDASKRWRQAYLRIRNFYERWGWLTVLACRFIGYVRPWASITAGLMKMRFLPFLAATAVGAAVWTLINWALIYYGVQLFAEARWFRWVALGILAAAIAGIAAFWWWWGRSGGNRTPREAGSLEANAHEPD